MKADQVTLTFNDEFIGEMVSPTGHVKLGRQTEGVQPYHLLFGALGSCFYATFLSVAHKMRLSFSDVSITVSGNKREEVPTTLDDVTIEMVVYNGSDEHKLIKAAELGAKYCSIHETISKVANIKLDVTFESKS
ncbi:MAG: OsmC family protein [Candidatus Izemoplasmataceae bacterium]